MMRERERVELGQILPLTPRMEPFMTGQMVSHRMDDERTVGFHMAKSLVTIQGGEPVINAYRLMTQYRIGCLPVLEGAKVSGLVTEDVLIEYVSRKTNFRIPVREVCAPSLVIDRRASIETAIDQLHEQHGRYLLVLSELGELLGMVSHTHLLEASRRSLVQAEARLEEVTSLAERDSLTGLFTRRVFERAFQVEFDRIRQYRGLLALLVLDVDHFKRVNDEHGHSAGDLALKRVGQLLMKHTRSADVSSRLGGDEFAVLMPGCGTRAAKILGERIRAELEQEVFQHAGRSFSITVSGGVGKWIDEYDTPQTMFDDVDRCLYLAKRKGRNQIGVLI